jgi:hypothetical protein
MRIHSCMKDAVGRVMGRRPAALYTMKVVLLAG